MIATHQFQIINELNLDEWEKKEMKKYLHIFNMESKSKIIAGQSIFDTVFKVGDSIESLNLTFSNTQLEKWFLNCDDSVQTLLKRYYNKDIPYMATKSLEEWFIKYLGFTWKWIYKIGNETYDNSDHELIADQKVDSSERIIMEIK